MSEAIEETVEQVDRLQQIRPLAALQGHEMCADIHAALSVANGVLTSRNERVAPLSEVDASNALLRELRALGINDASPQLVALLAIVDAGVGRLAEVGGTTDDEAWEEIRKEVLRKHCQDPASA